MKTNLPVTDREVTYGQDERIISTTDLKGMITSVNDVFVRISGFSREELIGSSHNIVRHPDMPPLAFENLWQTLQAGKPWIGVVKNRCKNGDFYWVHAYVSPVYEGEHLSGYQSVRYAPTREQVERADKLYRLVNKKKGGLGLLGRLQFRFNYAHLAFVIMSAMILTGIGAGILSGQLSPLYGLLALIAGLPLAFLIAHLATRPLATLRKTAKHYADNDLMEFVYSGRGQEASTVEHSLLMQQSKLNTVVGRLQHFAQYLMQAATSSTSAAEQSLGNVKQMEEEVEQVATAVTEMNATIEEIARNANTTAEKTQDTRTQVKEGSQALESATDEINDLNGQVEHIGRVIDQLTEDFRAVDGVLRFIDEISEQTNLLALNAAIEAARAGQHGRGFAVVADQVRLLANQTKESTKNIKSLLGKLDGDISRVRSDMTGNREQMQQVVQKISKLRTELDLIQESVISVTELNVSIASAVEQQHAVVDEISHNINNINGISGQTAEVAQQSSNAAVGLEDTAKELEVLVRQLNG
ncbi:MAG: methyl-accepting chemotaxis protein [Candidatus Thiodiazotropha taylori]|nr:methyl-accepting chemotaxis protein [Candidatus Thiodiazotropha endolucinida]MCW4228084.1 methyl-accepting chemotaxis protein [Candidatus Thiodiazotropha taylori]